MRGTPLSRSPGLRWTLAVTVAYLALVVLVPLGALLVNGARVGADPFVEAFTSPRVRAAFALTFGAALAAAALNAVFGFVLAWILVRYPFPGRRVADALVDLPMALPTAVAGIALTALFSADGWAGRPLAALGVEVNYTPLGVIVALTFIGVPFVVRSVQPVLESLDPELEEAAACLGARPFQTFGRVVLPQVAPAWLAGITLAFARAVGEYGSVVFISGNMPGRTEIVPLLIMTKLESYDYAGATALALLMLLVSVVLLVLGQRLEARAGRRAGLT